MGQLMQRLNRVFHAEAHHTIDRMEDPEAMLAQLERELLNSVNQARVALAGSRRLAQQLELRVARSQGRQKQLQQAAEAAVAEQNDALARQAISQRQALQDTATELQQQQADMEGLVAQQQQDLERLANELKHLRQRRAVLVQRERFARAANARPCPVDYGEEVSTVLARLEEKVAGREDHASASFGAADEQDLDSLLQQQAVNAELARLKAGNVDLNKGATQ